MSDLKHEKNPESIIETLDNNLVQDYLDTGSRIELSMVLETVTIYAYNEKNHYCIDVLKNECFSGENCVIEQEMCNYWEEVQRVFHHYVVKYMNLHIDKKLKSSENVECGYRKLIQGELGI